MAGEEICVLVPKAYVGVPDLTFIISCEKIVIQEPRLLGKLVVDSG